MTVLAPVAAPPIPESPILRRRRPGTRRYWIGAALTVVALAASFTWLVVVWFDTVDRIDAFARGPAPGSVGVRVIGSSTQVVYFEAARGSARLPVSELSVTAPDGAVVPVAASSHDVRYDVPHRHGVVGRAVATFRADADGTYRVTVARGAPVGTVAVGGDIARRLAPHVVGASLVALVGVSAGLALLVTTAVGRSRR